MNTAHKKYLLYLLLAEVALAIIFCRPIYREANREAHAISNVIIKDTFHPVQPRYLGGCLPKSKYRDKADADYYGCR